MDNALIIFENTLANNKDKASLLLEELTQSVVLKFTKNKRNNDLNILFIKLMQSLKKLDLLSADNATILAKALIKTNIKEQENILYQYLDEMSLLRSKIEFQKNTLKNEISKSFYELKESLQESEFAGEFAPSINEAFLYEVEMLGILKEIAESAFIATLEKGEDIELTISEIAKNLMYRSICEADFKKELILKNSQIILSTAFELANESKNYAKELSVGVVKGVQEGILQGIEKFKTSFTYCTLEEDLNLKERELIDIEDEFINLLKNQMNLHQNPVKDILKDLLENELDTLFAKLKRLASESREQLILTINDIKKNPKINDFSKLAQSKINIFKKEINDLEQLASERYKDFNTQEAKKLGVSLWEKAKKFISR